MEAGTLVGWCGVCGRGGARRGVAGRGGAQRGGARSGGATGSFGFPAGLCAPPAQTMHNVDTHSLSGRGPTTTEGGKGRGGAEKRRRGGRGASIRSSDTPRAPGITLLRTARAGARLPSISVDRRPIRPKLFDGALPPALEARHFMSTEDRNGSLRLPRRAAGHPGGGGTPAPLPPPHFHPHVRYSGARSVTFIDFLPGQRFAGVSSQHFIPSRKTRAHREAVSAGWSVCPSGG